MRQWFLITFIAFSFISFSHAVKNEEKTVFINDDGSNIILTNNRDGRIVHIFVAKTSDVSSDMITLQVMGVNIKTRSIHFKDEKVESEDKYQSEILKDTFRRFRGTIDSTSYQKLKGIIGKYVEKDEVNHNISSALKFLDAQGYELQSLLGNDDAMSCYPTHIIREERDTVRQILPHGKCMVTQNKLTVLKSSSGGKHGELFEPDPNNRRTNEHINYVDQSSMPVTTKYNTALHGRDYYPRRTIEPMDYDLDILRDPLYENYVYFNYEPSYTWHTFDTYPINRFETYQPEFELPLSPSSQWTDSLPNRNSLSYSGDMWH